MDISKLPKVGTAMYKAYQAKKQMERIKAAGKSEYVSVMFNGANELEAVELDRSLLADLLDGVEKQLVDKLANDLEKNIKKAFDIAKKNLEKELSTSLSIDDVKGLLGI